MKTNKKFWSYLAQFFFKIRNISDKTCSENPKYTFPVK